MTTPNTNLANSGEKKMPAISKKLKMKHFGYSQDTVNGKNSMLFTDYLGNRVEISMTNGVVIPCIFGVSLTPSPTNQ